MLNTRGAVILYKIAEGLLLLEKQISSAFLTNQLPGREEESSKLKVTLHRWQLIAIKLYP